MKTLLVLKLIQIKWGIIFALILPLVVRSIFQLSGFCVGYIDPLVNKIMYLVVINILLIVITRLYFIIGRANEGPSFNNYLFSNIVCMGMLSLLLAKIIEYLHPFYKASQQIHVAMLIIIYALMLHVIVIFIQDRGRAKRMFRDYMLCFISSGYFPAGMSDVDYRDSGLIKYELLCIEKGFK